MLELSSDIEIAGVDTIRLRLFIGGRVCCDTQLAHPDFGWHRYLMGNKLERNDLDGFKFNARHYLSLVDSLVDLEVCWLLKTGYEAIISVLELGMMALLIGMFFIAGSHFWLYVSVCALANLTMIAANLVVMRRYSAINRFRDRQLVMFENRCADFVKKEWGALCHCTGRKGELETQGYSSRRPQPIPVDIVALPVK